MPATATDPRLPRRRLLRLGGAAAIAAALTGPSLPSAALAERPSLAATGRLPEGGHALALLAADGRILRQAMLPGRGHGLARDPGGTWLVAFARRPGRFACALHRHDPGPRYFHCPPDRHFCGHGTFSADGRLLYATENDYDAARGVIGVYDAGAGFARLGELDSGGMDPHQVERLPSGRLLVANGGIETHPDYGRAKLNLPTMAPCIAVLDGTDGRILARAALPPALHRLSLRHLAVDVLGRPWIGGQHEGAETELPPLLAVLEGSALRQPPMAAELRRRYRNYVGSVAASHDRRLIATSSPRGGLVTVWEAASGRPLASHDLPDGCGLAALGKGFLATGGQGDLLLVGDGPTRSLARHRIAWDNHALAL